MTIHRLNNIIFDISRPAKIGEVNYAAGDLLKNEAIWPQLGITSEPDPAYPDPLVASWVYDYAPGGTLIVTPHSPELLALIQEQNDIEQDSATLKLDNVVAFLMANRLPAIRTKVEELVQTPTNTATLIAAVVAERELLVKTAQLQSLILKRLFK